MNPGNNTRNKTIGLLGVALAGLALTGSAFAIQPLTQGYVGAAAHAAEGKCGEGKCGAAGATPAKKGAASKAAEGKCGEGKCGAAAARPAKASAASKAAEGKCGEGQCGDARFAAADTDDDARVSRAEFLAIVPKGAALFAKKDRNADGYISERESYDSVKAAYNANGRELPGGLFFDVPTE